jgi:CRISPR/Cas system-associated endoribonuclease Cas2
LYLGMQGAHAHMEAGRLIVQSAQDAEVLDIPSGTVERVQRSVFVCTAGLDLITEIRSRLAGIIKPETDSVYVFRQCAACWDTVGIHGQAAVTGEPLYWAVL